MRSTSTPSEAGDPFEASYPGRFSNGRTAASHAVSVRFVKSSILIENVPSSGSDHGAVVAWPLSRIETGEPITRASSDVLVHEPGRVGATLFVADRAFTQALGQAAPQLTAAAQRWRIVRPFLLLTALFVGIAALVAAADFSPARTIAGLIPQSTRAILGQQVVRSLTGTEEVCSDAAGVAALGKLSRRLSLASGSKRNIEVMVVDRAAVNAFAAPGEVIVLMRGAIAQASGPDEVAGILAHEMGHGIELHPEAGIVRSVGLAVAGEMILGGTAGGSLANLGVVIANLGYSRSAEREADRHALAILKAAEISPAGLASFFARMASKEGARAKSDEGTLRRPDFLRTHPNSVERLEKVKSAGGYKASPALEAGDWAALRKICPGAPVLDPLPAPDERGAQPPATRSPRKQPPSGGNGAQRVKREA